MSYNYRQIKDYCGSYSRGEGIFISHACTSIFNWHKFHYTKREFNFICVISKEFIMYFWSFLKLFQKNAWSFYHKNVDGKSETIYREYHEKKAYNFQKCKIELVFLLQNVFDIINFQFFITLFNLLPISKCLFKFSSRRNFYQSCNFELYIFWLHNTFDYDRKTKQNKTKLNKNFNLQFINRTEHFPNMDLMKWKCMKNYFKIIPN